MLLYKELRDERLKRERCVMHSRSKDKHRASRCRKREKKKEQKKTGRVFSRSSENTVDSIALCRSCHVTPSPPFLLSLLVIPLAPPTTNAKKVCSVEFNLPAFALLTHHLPICRVSLQQLEPVQTPGLSGTSSRQFV